MANLGVGSLFNWKMIVIMALPMVRAAGVAKCNEDENTTGKDDLIGKSLIYAADLLESLINNQTPPRAPDVLR